MAAKEKIRSLVARDQLTADGGTVFRDPQGHPRLRRILKFGFSGGCFLLALFLALASLGLPFPGKVNAARAEATSIYARDGQTLLYKIRGDKNRTAIPFDQMPQCIKDATVSVEDKDFYKHHGFDPRGFGRAFFADITSRSTAGGGGSTITQQLVKNALLSPERTVTRKAKELVLSLEIEQMFSKDDILRLYLNEIPYGNNAYGIESASQTYFGKDAKDLTLSQCATLASIPRAPTYYSPYNNSDPNRLKDRSKFVLDQMVAQKHITPADSAAAKAEIDKGLEFAAAKGEDIKAPHFVFYVKEQLEAKYGTKQVEEGGMKVTTTLDAGKQDIAEDVVKTAAATRFKGYGASNAALTSIDPKTGQLLAMVGSVDYFDTAHDGNVNVATSDRQPGSSFKPVVYLKGFQIGRSTNTEKPLAFNPATLLWDVKTDFGGGYAPNDYDRKFRGPVSARDALQQSLNVPAVKMLDLIGINNALDLAHQLGITTLNNPDRYGDSLVLGGGEVKLLDLTSAYAVMANQGTAAWTQTTSPGHNVTVTPFLSIQDRKGKVLQRYDTSHKKEVVSKELAYQISDVLDDDAARAPQFGRGGPLTLSGREVAAKTGTTDSYRDAWTMGYTPGLAAGVWLGNNDNSPMNQVGGSIGAAPIWHDYMTRALAADAEKAKQTKFDKPAGIVEMKVDKLTGLLPKGGQTKTDVFTSGNKPTENSPVAASTGQCKPDVKITEPQSGQTDSGNIEIRATASSDKGIKQVEFTVDGQAAGTDDAPPFTASAFLDNGKHTITAKATGDCQTTISGTGLTSERPNNPAWETPVQSYIKSHGLTIGGDSSADETQTATDTITLLIGGKASPSPSPSPP